jgi:hypothetical protein
MVIEELRPTTASKPWRGGGAYEAQAYRVSYTPDALANAADLNTVDKLRWLMPRTVFGSNLRPNKEYLKIF